MRVRKLLAVAGLMLLIAVSGCGRRAPTEAQAGDYKAKAEPITKALEAHYAKYRRYPTSIEEIGLRHFETPFGHSRYEVMMDGQVCQLMIGNPETSSGFELHWTGTGKDSHKSPQKWSFVVHKK
jgi:hypothetical protein